MFLNNLNMNLFYHWTSESTTKKTLKIKNYIFITKMSKNVVNTYFSIGFGFG